MICAKHARSDSRLRSVMMSVASVASAFCSAAARVISAICWKAHRSRSPEYMA